MNTSPSSTPSNLINKRLQDILIAHECALSNLNLSSIEFQNRHNRNRDRNNKQQEFERRSRDNEAALYRSFSTSQPPHSTFQQCTKSNVNQHNDSLLVDLNLNPPERVSPQDLLIHDKRNHYLNSSNDGLDNSLFLYHDNYSNRRNNNISWDSQNNNNDAVMDVSSLTLKTITVLSTLCDEAQELYDMGRTKIIPRIYLFAHDLKEQMHSDENEYDDDDNNNNENCSRYRSSEIDETKTSHHRHHHHDNIFSSPTAPTTTNMLFNNETLMAQRDSKLLHRISTFIIHLQSTQNYVLRCHRLVRNIVCQLHGCLSEIVIYDDDVDDNNVHEDVDCHTSATSGIKDDGKETTVRSNDDVDNYNDDDGTLSSNLSVPLFIRHEKSSSTTKLQSNNESKLSPSNKTSNHEKSQHSTKMPSSKKVKINKTRISHPPLFHNAYHLTILGEAMSKLISILITLDAVIGSNFELHEAWDLYKSIVMERAEKLEENVAAAASATIRSDSLSSVKDHEYNNDGDISCDRETKGEDDQVYGINVIRLERMIMQIDFILLSSRSFIICIEQNFDPGARFCFNPPSTFEEKDTSYFRKKYDGNDSLGSGNTQEAKPLHEHMKIILMTLYDKYSSIIDTPKESTEKDDMVGIYGLYCLYRRLVPSNKSPDEKLHKMLCTSLCPVISLYGNISFMPTDFITKYAPLDYKSMRGRTRAPRPEDIVESAKELLHKQDKVFCKQVSTLYDEALIWILQAESDLAPSERINNSILFDDFNGQNDMILTPSDRENSDAMNDIRHKIDVIIKGLMIARRSTTMLKHYLFLHKVLHVAITPMHLHAVEQLCSIAKSVEKTLSVRRRPCIIAIHKAASKILASSLYTCFDKLRSYLDQRSVDHGKGKIDNVHISTISTSLWAVESILKGTSVFSPSRRYVIEIAIRACFQENFQCINSNDKEEIDNLLNELSIIAEIDETIVNCCNCSFLYFNKELYSVLLKDVYTKTEYLESERMQLLMSAFSDASRLLIQSSYFDQNYYVKQYRHFVIEKLFYRYVLVPLCFDIETSLRLLLFARNVHEMKPLNPKQQRLGQFRKYIEMPPLQICGVTIYTKKAIERHLEKSFYNFSTLSDAKTYASMAKLAKETYGLSLMRNNLPNENRQVIDFDDLLNVDEFSKKYNYNLVQQNFIERKSNDGSKYLKTIGIEVISCSLQRHGLRIANNLMSEIKNFILKKFQRLTEFFADDLFRSLLSKESRWLKQNHSIYTLDRAVSLQREISKIGQIDHNEGEMTVSYLDQCKDYITMLGNALGLARLVRSGILYSRNKSKVVYYEDESSEGDEGFLQTIVSQLRVTNNESSANPSSVSIDHTVLQNFYLLFPALSLCFLETSMRGKDMLNKKFQTFDAYYTDDGFAMGSAFILEVLNQTSGIDKLNWFESCCVRFARDRKDIIENIKKEINISSNMSSNREGNSLLFGSKLSSGNSNTVDSNTENELSRMRVLAKRLELRKKEMELLQYSVLGSRVFFNCTSHNT